MKPFLSAVDHKEYTGCQQPADGIDDGQNFDGVKPSDHCENPDYPGKAHTDAGNGGGNDRISGSPHGSCENLHRDEEEIEGDNKQHGIGTHLDHCGIGCIDSKKEVTENNGQGACGTH